MRNRISRRYYKGALIWHYSGKYWELFIDGQIDDCATVTGSLSFCKKWVDDYINHLDLQIYEVNREIGFYCVIPGCVFTKNKDHTFIGGWSDCQKYIERMTR